MVFRLLLHTILAALVTTTSAYAEKVGEYPVGKTGAVMQVETVSPKQTANKPAPSLKSRQMTSLRVSFFDAAGKPVRDIQDVEFNATMPAHKHGMNVTPKTTAEQSGTFRIDGIKLHMPGEWVLSFKVKHGVEDQLIEVPLTI